MRSGILSELMTCMHEGLLILNHLNIVEAVNQAALTILGLAAHEDCVGRHISDIRANTRELNELFTSFAEGDKNINRDDCGEEKQMEDSYSVRTFQHEADNSFVKLIILHDISSTNKAAETVAEHTRSLEKTNSELDQFAHIVSHDLKAPLRAISNLSLWLEEDLGASLSGDNKDNFNKLRSRVVRMESLINGILEYSKVGREQIPNESIDVFKLLNDVIELVGPPSHIKVEIGPDMPVIEAPRIMLVQIFSNLISNAIKYNDKSEGIVKVLAIERENCFEFIVQDNGPGIAPQYHEKIFVIFQTLQARDKFESTGIGLTIVKRVLAARGGKIWIESALGEGSKFIFAWPK
jgi:signal transduction histidine kinase